MKGPLWSNSEDERLIELWPTRWTAQRIAEDIGRSLWSTRGRARSLGLPAKGQASAYISVSVDDEVCLLHLPIPPQSDDEREARIFTGSMSDVFGRWVPAEWINAVLGVAEEARQWEFLMLTKFPKRMAEFDIPSNVWMGTTVDCQARVAAAEAGFAKVRAKVKWLSVEPMIEPLKFNHLDRFNMVVIGGASPSSKTPQWIPPYEWIADLMRQADEAGCAVYCKSNIYRKESPLNRFRYRFTDRAPKVFHYLGAAAEVA